MAFAHKLHGLQLSFAARLLSVGMIWSSDGAVMVTKKRLYAEAEDSMQRPNTLFRGRILHEEVLCRSAGFLDPLWKLCSCTISLIYAPIQCFSLNLHRTLYLFNAASAMATDCHVQSVQTVCCRSMPPLFAWPVHTFNQNCDGLQIIEGADIYNLPLRSFLSYMGLYWDAGLQQINSKSTTNQLQINCKSTAS